MKIEIRRNLRRHKTKTILDTIEKNSNIKVLKSRLSKEKQILTKLKNNYGIEVTSTEEITKFIE